MKYDIRVNQYKLVQIAPDLDIVDAAILDYLIDFCAADDKKIKQMTFEEGGISYRYTWINYQYLIDSLPLLRIKQKTSITDRLKKIKESGFIKTYLGPDQNTYVRLTEKIKELNFYQPSVQTDGPSVYTDRHHQFKLIDNNIDIINNIEPEKSDSVSSASKLRKKKETSLERTSVWEQNKAEIDKKKEIFSKPPYSRIDTEEETYDWRYLLNNGKCGPDRLFCALYWKKKEELSQGVFSYSFHNKDAAISMFKRESKEVVELASILTVNQFLKKLEFVDSLAFDEKKSEYKFEWKLTTVLKNLHNG